MSRICSVTGLAHEWVTPVRQVPPDTNYNRWSYNIPGQIVQSATVRCWHCGKYAPTGAGKEGDGQ